MEFSQPKGIYQQIADQMRDRILAGEWHEGERIPSVRELAVGVGVNPNTVTKSYQALLDRAIIENQRGLGYFVAGDAKNRSPPGGCPPRPSSAAGRRSSCPIHGRGTTTAAGRSRSPP